MLRIQTGDNDIVERDMAAGLQRDDQGTAFFKMLPKIVLRSLEHKSAKAPLLEVMFQIGGEDPMGPGRIESALDLLRIRTCIQRLVLLTLPELDYHRNTGSATSILFLLHEGNIQPHPGRLGRT